MKTRYPKIGMSRHCGLFGKTRQAYYKKVKTEAIQKESEAKIIKEVKEIRKRQPKIGTLKLKYILEQSEKLKIGRDRLYYVLRKNHMLVKKFRKYRPRQTNGDGISIYPDLRKGMKIRSVNQLWCSDITFMILRDTQKFCYLTCVLDEASHKIVGYNLSHQMKTVDVLKAFKMAVTQQLKPYKKTFGNELIIHSDRGSQYKSKMFKEFTNKYEIRTSMTSAGKSYENPVAERINGILKNELLLTDSFENIIQAKRKIEMAIKIYNEERPHLSCNLLTPNQAHEQNNWPLQKLWRQRKKKYLSSLSTNISDKNQSKLISVSI